MPHTTRWGNTYTDEEWAEAKAAMAEEDAEQKAILKDAKAIKDKMIARFIAGGIASRSAQTIARMIEKGNLDAKIADGTVRFSSEERKQLVLRGQVWYEQQLEALL